jgi:hypothetical protein
MTFENNGQPNIAHKFSNREVDWIFERLNNGNIQANSLEQKKSFIERCMHKSERDYAWVATLRLESESYLLPEKELKWISKDNIRLLRWIVHFCSDPAINHDRRITIPMPRMDRIVDSRLYDFITHALDKWEVDISLKRLIFSNMQASWSALLLKDSKLKWLHKDNESQNIWAWKYLCDQLIKTQSHSPPKYNPINANEAHLAVLSTFDTWSGDTGQLYELQTSMKQAWAQQKYRSNLTAKKKRQSTYVLGERTKVNLEELAVARNVNLNQMLEHIINEAYKDFKKGKT